MAEKKRGNKKRWNNLSESLTRLFVSSKEKEYVIQNLSLLIASGMGIMPALESILSEINSWALKKIITVIKHKVDGGTPLWIAIKESQIFSERVESLVRIGEESGNLASNLRVVSLQEEKEAEFRSKLKAAMMYPLFVMILTLSVGLGLAYYILPRLAVVFSQLKIELPLITKLLISFSTFLQQYGLIFIPSLLVFIIIFIYIFFFLPRTRFIGQAFLLSIPGVRLLVQQIEVARFGFLLGTLLDAGVPIPESIVSMQKATSFSRYRKFYLYLEDRINAGDSFHKVFLGFKGITAIFPVSAQQMIVSAEQSGSLSEMLVKVGSMYEAKTDATTRNLSVILEPILLVIVWLGVVAVAIAVIMPIYGLLSGINTNTDVTSATPIPANKSITVTPSVMPSVSPSPSATPSVSPIVSTSQQLIIIETGVRYVNVRSTASTMGDIVGRAVPSERYSFVSISNGWYEIVLPSGSTGWILSRYVNVIK